jgi:class 3 adenylate cyclase
MATTTADDVLKQLLYQSSASYDYLRVSGDETLIKFLDKHVQNSDNHVAVENVLFSDEILKVNKRGKHQKRELIITNISIHNFEPKKYKSAQRSINISTLRGIVINEISSEILIQVRGDYDYRLLIVRSADVIQLVMKLFAEITGNKLNLTVTQDDLSKLQVLKQDIKAMIISKRDSTKQNFPLSQEKSATIFAPANESLAESESPLHSTSHHRRSSNNSLDITAHPLDSISVRSIKEGWCAKRGDVNSGWKRRYFRLNENNLLYYEARLRSSQGLDSTAEVQVWINKRENLLEIEWRLVKNGEIGANHVRNMLKEPVRAESFANFVKNKQNSAEIVLELYQIIENLHDSAISSAEIIEKCTEIYNSYVKLSESSALSAVISSEMRETLAEYINNPQQISNSMYSALQAAIVNYLLQNFHPEFLKTCQNYAELYENLAIKQELSENDKKAAQCSACLANLSGFSASFFGKRQFCKFCGEVHCRECLQNEMSLPKHYNYSELARVCDCCSAVLSVGSFPHAFSIVSKRFRPINLAAPSGNEQEKWVSALRTVFLGLDHGVKPSEPTHKEGWLMIQSAAKLWRRCYLVLDAQKLFFYDLRLKKSVPISEGCGIHASNEVKPTISESESQFNGLRSVSGFAYRFHISYKQRVYKMSADTGKDMLEWIEALNQAVRKNRAEDRNKQNQQLYSESYHQEAPEGEVSFVFTDVQSSTKLWETVPEAMNASLQRHDQILRQLLKNFRGYEVKTEGDAFMVTFFSPIDAVRWCLAAQKALLEANWPEELLKLPAASQEFHFDPQSNTSTPIFNGIRVRMGVHCGSPACRRNPTTGRMDYFGPVVNRSARVADSAHGGQIICTEEVQAKLVAAINSGEFKQNVVIEELGSHKYKGIGELVTVFQVSSEHLLARNPFPPLRSKEEAETVPNSAHNSGPAALHKTVISKLTDSDLSGSNNEASSIESDFSREESCVSRNSHDSSMDRTERKRVSSLLRGGHKLSNPLSTLEVMFEGQQGKVQNNSANHSSSENHNSSKDESEAEYEAENNNNTTTTTTTNTNHGARPKPLETNILSNKSAGAMNSALPNNLFNSNLPMSPQSPAFFSPSSNVSTLISRTPLGKQQPIPRKD